MKSLLKKKFVRFLGVSFVGMFLTLFLTMLSSILTARLLGAEGKGVYTLLYTTMVLAIAVIAPKPALSQVYYRKEHDFNVLVSNTILISVVAGLFTVAGAIPAIALAYDYVFDEVPGDLLVLIVIAIPVYLYAENMTSMLVADYDIPAATLVRVTRPGIFLTAFSLAAIFGSSGLKAATVCILISVTGMAVVASVLLLRRGFDCFSVDFSLVRSMVYFSFKTHFGILFRFLQNRFDIFIVAYFLSAREVGIYSIALVIAEVLWRFPKVVNNVLLPRLSGESDRRSAEITAKLNRIVFALTAILLVPFVALAYVLLPILYGQEFAEAADVIPLLLPGVLAITVFKLLAPNLIMRGRAWTYSFSVLASLIAMIVLDIVLIPRYGITGAAIASSIAYICASLVVLITVVRINALPLRTYFDVLPDLREVWEARVKAS